MNKEKGRKKSEKKMCINCGRLLFILGSACFHFALFDFAHCAFAHPKIILVGAINLYSGTSKFNGAGPFLIRPEVS